MKITIKGKKPNGASFNHTHTVTEEEFNMIDHFLSFDRKSFQFIDHSNLVIKEYFAGDGKVCVGHSSNKKQGHYIYFSDLEEQNFSVGEDLLDKEVKETDRTVVFFKNVESLEVLQNSVDSCREKLTGVSSNIITKEYLANEAGFKTLNNGYFRRGALTVKLSKPNNKQHARVCLAGNFVFNAFSIKKLEDFYTIITGGNKLSK